MGAQGESVRSERKRSLVVPVLVMLLIRLAVEANAAQLRRAEITAQKAEAEAAQRLEAEQRSEAARAVQAQASEGETPQFTPDDDVHAAEVKALTFSVPTSWVEQTRYSEELVEFEPNTYDGFFEAGMVPDLCLAATSAEDAVRQVSSRLDVLVHVGDDSWSGTMGQALWYRYPVQTGGGSSDGSSHGFLEVILSGRDAYFIVTLCRDEEYTAEVQNEMLRVLASVSVADEASLFNEHTSADKATADGMRCARDLAGEGAMADFLMSLGDFRTLELSGSGSDVIAIPRSTDVLRHPCFCLVTVTYEGTGRFVVKRVEEPGGEGVVLIDHEGPYHGVVTNIGDVGKTVQQDKLEVTAEGAWSIMFAPLADTPAVENGATYTGDALAFMDEDSIEQLRYRCEGDGEFSVYAAGCDGSASLVDETGPCDGTAAWEDPHTLFIVHADGDWSLSW